MVSKNEIIAISQDKDLAFEIYQRRAETRKMYLTDTGIDRLFDILKSAKIFDVIDPTDQASIGARNLAIGILTDLGLLDEETIKDEIRLLLKNAPIVPDGFMDMQKNSI